MAHPTRTHLPEDDYLLLIGQLAYMVTALEGLIIFDLPGMADHLPASLTAGSLSGLTTGQIARALTNAAGRIEDADVRRYVELAGQHLADASSVRNDLLHARPATIDGKTRLYRWRQSDQCNRHPAFPITDDWLRENIDRLSEASNALNAARPLHKNSAFAPRHAADGPFMSCD
jgi:hypothetical protein